MNSAWLMHWRGFWLAALLGLATSLSLLLPLPSIALDLIKLQARFAQYGGAPERFEAWQTLLHEQAVSPINLKLQRVNQFFNQQIEFGDDQAIWGQADYWATPLETLAKGRGDCEDFVIAKYFTLLNLNVPSHMLRLIYVKAQLGAPHGKLLQAHMVLAYYPMPDAEPLLLDNLVGEILPASRRPDLQPVFSFNSEAVFAGVDSRATAGPRGIAQLSRWQNLLARAHAEGF